MGSQSKPKEVNMAQGDITKEIEYDKIEVVSTWSIQVREATRIMEEGVNGVKT